MREFLMALLKLARIIVLASLWICARLLAAISTALHESIAKRL